MKSVEEYIERYRATLQEAIPEEPVWGLGLVSLAGSMKSVFAGLASPLAGVLMRRKGRSKAPGFPMNSVIGVTPTRFIAFEYRPRGTGIKLKKRIVEWPRQQVHVQIVPASSRGLHHVVFTLPDATTYEFELASSFGQYANINNSFYTAIGVSSPA